MNRRDVQKLRVHTGASALTVIGSCDSGGLQKKLVAALESCAVRLPSHVVDMALALARDLACKRYRGKVAIFIDKHRVQVFSVPASVNDYEGCSDSFFTASITAAMNRLRCYWVIDVLDDVPRLMHGVEDDLSEEAGLCALVDTDERSTHSFDHCIVEYLEQDRLPIVVIGDVKKAHTLLFDASYEHSVIGIASSRDEVWPAVQRYNAQQTETLLKIVDQGKAGVDYIADHEAIVEAARQGMIVTLGVEQHFEIKCCEHDVTREIFALPCRQGSHLIALADELIESVRAKGGSTVLVPDGSLKIVGRMIALVRD